MSGVVDSLWLAAAAGAPMRRLDEVQVEAGAGLAGDRYALRAGTWSRWPGDGRHVTLIAAEAIAAVEAELGVALPPGATRRNLVTRGADLDALVGRGLAIGPVRLRATRRCEPCDHLARLAGEPRLLRALVGRGGLRCDVLRGGTLRVGDPLEVEMDA